MVKKCEICKSEFTPLKKHGKYCSTKCKSVVDNGRAKKKRIESRLKCKVVSLNGEVWKPVVGYEGYYDISNFGRLKKLQTVYESTLMGGSHKYLMPETLIECSISGYGYIRSTLTRDKVRRGCLIHRLVAMAFIPNPENKRTVNHKDGDKLNNHVSNLEWATDQENLKHSWETGLHKSIPKGRTHYAYGHIANNAKEVVCTETGRRWESAKLAAKDLGIRPQALHRMLNGGRANKTTLVYVEAQSPIPHTQP